eukprot:COSAG05_NODE_841_length_7021_cov_5.980352_7_plen_714_part_01
MGERELARVTASCRELRNLFDRSEVWALRCGMRVANLHQLSEHFSTFLLARHIHARRTHTHLERNILLGLGAAPESQLLSSSSVTEVFVCEEPQDEQAFWTKRLASSLRTSAVPTISQVGQLQTALAVVLGIAEDSVESMATIEEIVAMVSADGTNDVLRAAVFSLLCDPELMAHMAEATVDKKDSAAGTEDEPMEVDNPAGAAKEAQDARLAKMSKATSTGEQPPRARAAPLIGERGFTLLTDVSTVQHAVGFLHGLNVDELMEEKWKLKKKGMPLAVQRAFLDAFASFSVVQLCDLWRTPGFWKAFFRSTHMNKLILRQVAAEASAAATEPEEKATAEAAVAQESKKKLNSSTADLLKVGFFLSALHEAKYPESAEKFVELDWACRIVEPMRAMCTHPLFSARDPAWLLPEFQGQLAGKKLKLPVRNSLPAVLSREGNTRATWLKLFEADAVTMPQVLGHLRSLALLEFPVAKVEQLIAAKLETGAASMGLTELMRIRTLLATGVFTEAQIEGLRTRVQAAQQAGAVHCRVPGIAMSFRDKRGQSSTQQKTKNIGCNFGMDTVEGYQNMAQNLLAAQLNAQPAAALDTIAAVVLTHELQDNLVRTGIPPRTPPYAPASLWRGEALALERLDAVSEDSAAGKLASEPEPFLESDSGEHETSSPSRFQNLIVGITWCEHPSDSVEPKHVRVDLDLSVIAFDHSWSKLAHCSYTS